MNLPDAIGLIARLRGKIREQRRENKTLAAAQERAKAEIAQLVGELATERSRTCATCGKCPRCNGSGFSPVATGGVVRCDCMREEDGRVDGRKA